MRKGGNKKAEIVLLDHGLYETISSETRISLCKFWECLVLKDVQGLKKYAKELNVDGKTIMINQLVGVYLKYGVLQTTTS